MKTILEYLFSKKSDLNKLSKNNRFHITKKDLIEDLEGFPVGVVVRMLEEQEKQGNNPDVKVFQKKIAVGKDQGGISWGLTEAGFIFWDAVINYEEFTVFYKRYPEYKKFDI